MPDKPGATNARTGSLGMPKPTPMPAEQMSSVTSPQKPPQEMSKVAGMDDYPGGRGGMRMVAMATVEQSQPAAVTPHSSIGLRPPAMRMPKSGS